MVQNTKDKEEPDWAGLTHSEDIIRQSKGGNCSNSAGDLLAQKVHKVGVNILASSTQEQKQS